MSVLEMIGAVLLILGSIIVIALVAMQNPKTDGVSALAGAGSFLGAGGRDRSMDAKLNRLIKVLAIAFFVIVVAVYAITSYL